ncbi:MAG: rubrerythrin family protein [Clostridia bacterium]|nr:rubrerythrin family protein [Clostridia bacterium]
MKLKDSKTYENLARAYAAECQARTRYEFVEYGLRYNGFEALAQIVDTIAYQEFNHARMLYTQIQGADQKQIDNIDISAGFPFKEKWDMEKNLKLLAEDEFLEAEAYKEFVAVAEKEGFSDIATLFKQIGEVEIRHQKLFLNLYEQFKNGTLYKKKNEEAWICPNCGYIEFGKEAWEKCPLCEAEQGVCQVVVPEELRCW